MLFDIQKHILKVHSIFSTLRQNTNVEKVSLRQNKPYKKCTLLSIVSSNSSVLLSIHDSSLNWKAQVSSF